ncbi:secreted protein [Aspergillus violaceofuscus CBS 115571]|uniref:Secreted protein n=1 Tax=Aspergillus violaceofuscus (strain CBS 115571) TaxID=1450538 RepID=A0A2V5HG87_ASPV1|nr:secreted protein [Aspergillus violaceofuscus CBS 115571]
MLYLLLLVASALIVPGTSAHGTNDQVLADLDYGTFQNPSNLVRPRFRYWVNDASVSPSTVEQDLKDIAKSGAGGLELLGYYNYGDSDNFGGGLQAPLQADWTEYGFGSPAWKNLSLTVLRTAKELGLVVDFAVGPNQGAGVPAPYHDEALLWDLAAHNATFSTTDGFEGRLPGWGTGQLVAAVTGSVKSSSGSVKVLATDSLRDVTGSVSSNGHVEISSSQSATTTESHLFAYYLVHADYREVQSPADVPVAVPQSPIKTWSQNGSWVVDHFSVKGAQLMASFWQQSLLDEEMRELLHEVGNYMWEDSQEYKAATWWTPHLPQASQANRGYNILKYLPIVVGSGVQSSNVTYVTDEADEGKSHVQDYEQTLTELNAEYLRALAELSNGLGVQWSSQVVYNMPMDMLANIPAVNGPETETLGFNNLLDGYRQFAGPAHLAGKRIVSSEAGAIMGSVYQETIDELLWGLKRSLAGSVNNFILHGWPMGGNYGNTTWPGFTTFAYLFSEMHGPRQPAFEFYSDWVDYVARNQWVAQIGIPKVDIAFWAKNTTGYESIATLYAASDLEDAGYTYEYLSPDNFNLPEAYVANGILAPNRQAFKALVVRANETLTVNGVAKLVEYAHEGLPIVFPGGLPSTFSGYDPKGQAQALHLLQNITSLLNVHLVSDQNLAQTLQSLNLHPRTAIATNSTVHTTWRYDPTTKASYIYIFNDAAGRPANSSTASSGTITFATTGTPHVYDAWTGAVSGIAIYNQSAAHTTIPINLAGNQTLIIGFHHTPNPNTPPPHIPIPNLPHTTLPEATLSTQHNLTTLTLKRTYSTSPLTLPLSTSSNKTLPLSPILTPPIQLKKWTLTLESWTPPADIYNITPGPTRTNTTYPNLNTLLPWSSLNPALQNVSGIGYYTTTFTLSQKHTQQGGGGAILDLGRISHAVRVKVNGQAIGPVDLSAARKDIGAWVRAGRNTVEVVVASPLGNVLRAYWGVVGSGGKGAAETGALPGVAEYGLVGTAWVVPYEVVEVELGGEVELDS